MEIKFLHNLSLYLLLPKYRLQIYKENPRNKKIKFYAFFNNSDLLFNHLNFYL